MTPADETATNDTASAAPAAAPALTEKPVDETPPTAPLDDVADATEGPAETALVAGGAIGSGGPFPVGDIAAEDAALANEQAAFEEQVQRRALELVGSPVTYRAGGPRLRFNGCEHHAAIVTKVHAGGVVNIKVFPDNAATFDLQNVQMVSKHPYDLAPGEACPARF